jgi:hypothetical protein
MGLVAIPVGRDSSIDWLGVPQIKNAILHRFRSLAPFGSNVVVLMPFS